jgi:preprotein translocase subunit YajC
MNQACAQTVPGPQTVSSAAETATPSVPGPAPVHSSAVHETPAPRSQGFDWMGVAPMVLIFVVFYFFMIRPQQKKMKQQRDMLAALKPGDPVVTTGGLLGRVSAMDGEHHLMLEVAKGVEVRVLRSAVSEVTSREAAAGAQAARAQKGPAKKGVTKKS